MNLRKKLAIGVLSLVTVIGTYSGNGGGLPPLYVVKEGTSGGACVGLVTKFKPNSKFFGPVFSLLNTNKGGKIYGLTANIINRADGGGEMWGLEASVIANVASRGEDRVAPNSVYGAQFSIFGNEATPESKCLQFGIYNRILVDNKEGISGAVEKQGLIFNYNF